MDNDPRPPQLHGSDKVIQSFGDWAIIESAASDRFVSHVGRPEGWPPIGYDIDFDRLSENWERQLDEKTWMSTSSKADLARALTAARAMA
jgi:hypothetical protein